MFWPALKPAASIARTTKSSPASAEGRFGAKPPSSPTLVLWPACFSAPFSVWNTSAPMRTASASEGAPTGMQHHGVRAMVDRRGDVGRFGAGRRRRPDHRLQHLGRDHARL